MEFLSLCDWHELQLGARWIDIETESERKQIHNSKALIHLVRQIEKKNIDKQNDYRIERKKELRCKKYESNDQYKWRKDIIVMQ